MRNKILRKLTLEHTKTDIRTFNQRRLIDNIKLTIYKNLIFVLSGFEKDSYRKQLVSLMNEFRPKQQWYIEKYRLET